MTKMKVAVCGTPTPKADIMKAFLPKDCLAIADPELAAQWHPTRNGDLTPDMVTAESHRKIWWLGKCGHEWSATIESRTRGMGCPFCHKAG